MAISAEDQKLIDELRNLGGVAVGNKSDEELLAIINANDRNVRKAAASLWSGYAAKYANSIDISEGSSHRKMSSIYSQALKMAEFFTETGDDEELADGRTRTYRIKRS